MSERLTPFSRTINQVTLIRLQRVMTKHGLKKIQVADLFGISRSLVSRWFAHHKLCPEHAPEHLRTIMDIRSRANINAELRAKKLERRKHK